MPLGFYPCVNRNAMLRDVHVALAKIATHARQDSRAKSKASKQSYSQSAQAMLNDAEGPRDGRIPIMQRRASYAR
ncbi:hypothetical protein BX591_10640 [Paraburkholderia bryophila]|uniref:Uncharacterized protein n=1 Tax=Paraburkholderia bryophila TaxID=420952 RepID=A0A329CI48_9BURK|nr:hypothetical protein BX591_10640 [Paraburkholderia bryophila]